MYQVFYTLTAVLITAWIVFLFMDTMGQWTHVFLAAALVCMAIGLFMRSSKG